MKNEVDLVAGKTCLRKARRLPCRRRKTCVTAPAQTAPRGDEADAWRRQVGDEPTLRIEHLCPDRDADLDALAVGAMLLAPTPVTASAGA